jgi:Fe-S-cluster-containing hydrogenase component 2
MKKKTITLIFTVLIVAVLFAAGFRIIIDENKCVGCEDCTLVCPTNAIDMIDGKAVIDQSKCIKCDICVPQCTYDAIKKVK